MIIGERIRQIRKDKQITLKSLAEGICSLGKMSNIENGKVEPTLDELKKFSAKLGVLVSELSVSPTPKEHQLDGRYDDLVKMADDIEDLLELKCYEAAKEKLLSFSEETNKFPGLYITEKFLWAWYYKSTNNDELSEMILKDVLNVVPLNEGQSVVQLRSKHLLCCVYYKNNEIVKAVKLVKEIRDQVIGNMNVFGSELWKFRFNLCVVYFVKGDYELARLYAGIISREKTLNFQSEFLLGLIDLVNNEISKATEHVYKAKKGFRDTGNSECLLKAKLTENLVQLVFMPNGQRGVKESEIAELLNAVSMVKDKNLNLSVYALNLLLYVCLEDGLDNEINNVERLLSDFLKYNINDDLKSQSCLYLAKLYKKRKEEKSKIISLLNLGLENGKNRKTVLHGMLLYEKAKIIEDEKNSLYKDALDSMVEAENFKLSINLNLKYLLPELVF